MVTRKKTIKLKATKPKSTKNYQTKKPKSTTKTIETKSKTLKKSVKKSKKSITTKTKIVCLSHKEDADGISSAALIKEAFGGISVLVDYPGQMEALEEIASDEKLKKLYICDLGLSKKNQDQFVEIIAGLRKRRVLLPILIIMILILQFLKN